MAATFIDPFRGETEHELDMLGRYIEASETGLRHARDEDRRTLDEQAAKIEGGFVEVTGAYIGHAWDYQEQFPMLMRHGHVIAMHSLVEHRLRTLCDEVCRRRGNLPVGIKDLKGFPYVEASQTFLTKIVDAGVTQWGEVRALSSLRNCIVHCNGFIDEASSPAKIEGIVKNTKGLSLNDQRRLLIERAYVDRTYSKICEMFTTAFTSLHFGGSFYHGGFPAFSGIVVDEEAKRVTVVGPESSDEEWSRLFEDSQTPDTRE